MTLRREARLRRAKNRERRLNPKTKHDTILGNWHRRELPSRVQKRLKAQHQADFAAWLDEFKF